MTAAKRMARHRRALWVSTALAAVLGSGLGLGPARAQSVTGTGNVYGSSTPSIPAPPLPVWSIPTQALYVGITAPGTLTIQGGGSVSDKSAYVGNVSTGDVTVTGAGSTWTNSSVVNIGYGAVPGTPGTGTLTIEDGGYVYSGVPGSSNTGITVSGIIGTFYAGVGTVTVSGTDAGGHASAWVNAGRLMVGRYGRGTLTIEGGGTVSNTDGYIGVFADSTGTGNGTVTVSGSDGNGHASTWASSGDLIVGHYGTGTLKVEAGGTVSDGGGYIGYYSIGSATVTSTDGDGHASTWASSGDLYVGVYGIGTLNIEAGGVVSNVDGVIGYDNTGSATVTGTDSDGHASAWNSSDDLYVGFNGDGTLTIADGGRVSASGVDLGEAGASTGTINIGAAAGDAAVAAGTLDAATVAFRDGTGTLVFNHTGATTFAAALTSTGSGTHALNHYAGTTTLTGDSSGFKGTTTVDGGTLLVGDAAGNGKLGGTVHVGANGTLGGSGSILGATTIDGRLSAGNSPGTLTFASDLTLNAGSTSVFELNSPGVVGGTGAAGNDLVAVAGDLTVAGTLDARVAAAGYYRLFNYGGTLSGAFSGGTLTGTGGFAPTAPNNPDIQYGIPSQVNLSVLAAGQIMQFWDGPDTIGNGIVDGGPGTWSTAGTNWTGRPGEANINSAWGGSVGVFAGAAGGTVTVAGTQSFDTLQFSTNGYTLQGGALAIGVSGGGTLNVDNGISTAIASTIDDGAGSMLRKTGAGTLFLSGANVYTGGTILLGGVLSVSADANLGAPNGGLTFSGGTLATSASFDSSRAITLDAAGTVDVAAATLLGLAGAIDGSGALVKQGAGTLVLSGPNTYAGGTRIVAGALRGSAAGFGSGAILDDGALVIDQPTDAVFANAIDGTGSFIKTGAGMLTLNGVSTLSGPTRIEEGLLTIGGSLAHSIVTVASDGTLGGGGTVGGIVAQSGGTVAPGNGGIGTLTVQGNLAMAAGAHLAVEIDGTGASDRVAVSGTADISGSALDVAATGVKLGSYTIVSAGGGLTGTFGSVTAIASAFLGFSDRYDANNAYLDVLRVRDFADAGLTPNQKAAAGGIQSLTGGNPLFAGNALYDAVLALPTDAAARAAFDLASGEGHASARTALIDDSRFVRNAAIDRIRSAFDTVGATHTQATAFADPGDVNNALAYAAPVKARPFVPARTAAAGPALWGQAFGSWGHVDGDGNAARLSRDTGGLVTGGDVAVLDTWRVGLMGGYSRTTFRVKDRASSGISDNYHVGVYGGTQSGPLGLRLGAAYSWHDIATSRGVAFASFADSPRGDYNAGTTQVFGELGYGIRAGNLGVEPFVNAAYVDLHTDGFVERGGAAALRGARDDTGVTFTTLGLHLSSDVMLGTVATTARGTLGWRHAFGDTTPLATLALAGGLPFTVAGVPIAQDAALIDAGLDFAIARNATLGIAYSGQFATRAADQSVKGSLAIRF